MSTMMSDIGKCVRLVRTIRNLTQAGLGAEAGGLSQSTISRIEQGRAVRTDQLDRVLRALRCDLRQLLEHLTPAGTFHVVFKQSPTQD